MVHQCPVLSVSPVSEDHASLKELLRDSPWLLRESHSLRSALMVLEEQRIPLLICERDLRPGTWRDLIDQVAGFPCAPCTIVASRQADETLWVQALSAGAFDVLAKPFNRSELYRTLLDAWLQWENRYEYQPAPKVMTAGA